MKSPTHHPDERVLRAFAAASLGPLAARVAAVHVRQCAQCAGVVASADALGGALLEKTAPVALSKGAFASLISDIARQECLERQFAKSQNSPGSCGTYPAG